MMDVRETMADPQAWLDQYLPAAVDAHERPHVEGLWEAIAKDIREEFVLYEWDWTAAGIAFDLLWAVSARLIGKCQ